MTEHARTRPGPMAALLREPLVHFLAIAALLFAARTVWAPEERETILVTASMAEELANRQAEVVGRDLLPEERAEVVRAYIEEEALVREARRLSFDNDSRTRRHLAMKMRFFLDEERPAPSVEQLRSMYEADADRYRSPERRVVRVVTLAEGADAEEALSALRDDDPDALGLESRTLPRHSEYDVRMAYGPEFAEAVFGIEDEAWHGPLPSSRGLHLVRVPERFESVLRPFEEMEDYLRQEWDFTERRRIVSEKTDAILERYDVRIEPAGGEP